MESVRNVSTASDVQRPVIVKATRTNELGNVSLAAFDGRRAGTAVASLSAAVLVCALWCGSVGRLSSDGARGFVDGLTTTAGALAGGAAIALTALKPTHARALSSAVGRASRRLGGFALRDAIRNQANGTGLLIQVVWFVLGKLAGYASRRTRGFLVRLTLAPVKWTERLADFSRSIPVCVAVRCTFKKIESLARGLGPWLRNAVVGNLADATSAVLGRLESTLVRCTGFIADDETCRLISISAYALHGVVARVSDRANRFARDRASGLRNSATSLVNTSGVMFSIAVFVSGELAGHLSHAINGRVDRLKCSVVEWAEYLADETYRVTSTSACVLHYAAALVSDRANRFVCDRASALRDSVASLVDTAGVVLTILAFVSGELAGHLSSVLNGYVVRVMSTLGRVTEYLADRASATVAILSYALHAVSAQLYERINGFARGLVSGLNVSVGFLVCALRNTALGVLAFDKVTEILVYTANASVRILDLALGKMFDLLNDRLGVDLITMMDNLIRDARVESNTVERVVAPTTITAGGNHGESPQTEQLPLKGNMELRNSVIKSNSFDVAPQECISTLIKKGSVSECNKKPETSAKTISNMPHSNRITTRHPTKRVPHHKFTWSNKLKYKQNPNILPTLPPPLSNPGQFLYGYHNYDGAFSRPPMGYQNYGAFNRPPMGYQNFGAFRRPPTGYQNYGAFRRPQMWQQTYINPRSFSLNNGFRLNYPVQGSHVLPPMFNAYHMLRDEN